MSLLPVRRTAVFLVVEELMLMTYVSDTEF